MCLFAICRSLFDVRCLLIVFVVGCRRFVRCLLLAVRCVLSVVCCSSRVVCGLLLVGCWLLCVVSCV